MKRRTILDFTPLLDVILIILFLVLMTSATSHAKEVEEKDNNLQALHEQVFRLSSEVQELKSQVIPSTPTEDAWLAAYSEDIAKMELRYPTNPNKAMVMVYEDGSEYLKPQADDLKEWLQKAINRSPRDVKILSFSYDDDSIFWRDYESIRNTLIQVSRNDKTLIFRERPEERNPNE